jgi:hypothetical protein
LDLLFLDNQKLESFENPYLYNTRGLAHVGPIPEILTALTLELQG